MFNIKPHPNYLKVLNSYIWFLFCIYTVLIINAVEDVIFILVLVFIGLLLSFYGLKNVLKNFMVKEFKIDMEMVSKVTFKSFLLENAYGVGTLIINDIKYKGVHIEDYRALKNKMEF